MIERSRAHYPPAQRNNAGVVYYSAIGTIAEVAVDTGSGEIELLNHHSVLECGNPIVPELVSGQLQGGLAMGIGHALHEYLPLYEDGPGNGTWNFNRYTLPRAKDVAVWQQTGEVLPALSDTDPPKGMAEVVMIAVVPAIVNAIAHATGLRFRELPVTAEKVRAALATGRVEPRHPRRQGAAGMSTTPAQYAAADAAHQRRSHGPIDVPEDMMLVDVLHEYLGLTGTRFGCGQGVCRACTVIVDDERGPREVRSCITGAHYFDGKRIRTVEGHAKRDASGADHRTVAGAAGLPRPLQLPVRLLHAGLRQCRHGADGAPGKGAGRARTRSKPPSAKR